MALDQLLVTAETNIRKGDLVQIVQTGPNTFAIGEIYTRRVTRTSKRNAAETTVEGQQPLAVDETADDDLDATEAEDEAVDEFE